MWLLKLFNVPSWNLKWWRNQSLFGLPFAFLSSASPKQVEKSLILPNFLFMYYCCSLEPSLFMVAPKFRLMIILQIIIYHFSTVPKGLFSLVLMCVMYSHRPVLTTGLCLVTVVFWWTEMSKTLVQLTSLHLIFILTLVVSHAKIVSCRNSLNICWPKSGFWISSTDDECQACFIFPLLALTWLMWSWVHVRW